MESRLTASTADPRLTLTVFETFGSVALLLAAIGIYGVLSGSVTERTREIDVHFPALGATRANILALIVRQGLNLALVGVLIGLLVSLAASNAISTLLFGVSAVDPITYAAVIALLLSACAVTCWVPAWRAVRVNPSIAFRAE